MNIIFICTANRDRSRTAEIYYQNKYPEHRFRSAGINKYLCERHGGIYVKKYMLDVADRIICAEKLHSDWIVQNIGKEYLSKIEILNLGNTETFMSSKLIEMLDSKFIINNNQQLLECTVCWGGGKIEIDDYGNEEDCTWCNGVQ